MTITMIKSEDSEKSIKISNLLFIFFKTELVIYMVLINFKDGVVIELHEDMSFDVVELSRTDVEFNYFASVSGKEVELFNAVDNRLGGVLSA